MQWNALLWLGCAYLAVLGVALFVLLFGESAAFRDTIVGKTHWFFTQGLCHYSGRAVRGVFGERAETALSGVGEYCCDRPNPFMQLCYLLLVLGGYFVFCERAFEFIPGPHLASYHLFTGPLAVAVGLGLFLLTSFSDPGTVTAANVEAHLRAFAHDGQLYRPKQCSTLRLPVPARSKFCRVTNRRVARFDHFCGWMNNTIGENNLRFFLAFLLWHAALCFYGVYLVVAILAGEASERQLVQTVVDHRNARLGAGAVGRWSRSTVTSVVRWLLHYHSVLVLLAIFVALTGVMLVCFLGYHLWLVANNTTTYETFKWADYREEARAAALELAFERAGFTPEQMAAAMQEPAGGWRRWRRWLLPCLSAPRALPPGVVPVEPHVVNEYNHGVAANFAEVLFPRSKRRR